MSEIKTKATKVSAEKFLNKIKPEGKKMEGFVLLELFKKITGEKPVMWGPSIVGFGTYHYKSEKSAQEGDWMLTGFSPRKQALSIYVLTGGPYEKPLLKKLGKHKTGMGCLYINKLGDVNQKVLAQLIKKSFQFKKKTYGK